MTAPQGPYADEVFAHATLAARQAANSPADGEDALDAALRAYTEALARAGMLAVPETEEEWSPPDAARWLAEASEYPRYSHGLGWHLLLGSETNIKQAVRKARQAHEDDPDPTFRARLTRANEVLMRYAKGDGE
jgi:hypothetical protein